MIYIMLIVGLVALIKGADVFVNGSSGIAKKFGIPSVIIGLTIVSLGTSLPEAAVSITASFVGSNELAISNVTGSNIFNLMIVAALCIILKPMTPESSLIKRDFPVAVVSTVALILFMLDGTLGRIDAIIFLLGCIIYILVLIKDAKKDRGISEDETKDSIPIWLCVIYIIVGIAAIAIGGDMVVDSAVEIARIFGLSETLIGLTIVAIGTSLPELATSVVAAKKDEAGLAMGNAVGSCILNILFILGLSSILSPVSVLPDALIHSGFMLFTTVLMFFFVLVFKSIGKREGIISILIYVGYMVYVVVSR